MVHVKSLSKIHNFFISSYESLPLINLCQGDFKISIKAAEYYQSQLELYRSLPLAITLGYICICCFAVHLRFANNKTNREFLQRDKVWERQWWSWSSILLLQPSVSTCFSSANWTEKTKPKQNMMETDLGYFTLCTRNSFMTEKVTIYLKFWSDL